MAIRILELREQRGAATYAVIAHGDHVFDALVHGDAMGLSMLVGSQSIVEMSFDEVLSWDSYPEFDDGRSRIFAASGASNTITLAGRVHNVTDVGDGVHLIDVYLQTGAEFIALSSDDLGGHVPRVGTGLAVTVRGLCFYPTRT